MIIFDEASHGLSLVVDVSHGFISAILSNILPWEDKAISIGSSQRHGVVAIVHRSEGKLLEISDEACEHVSLWHIKS